MKRKSKTLEQRAAEPGPGWVLLPEGTPLKSGDGFIHPDKPGMWLDFGCRPDIFRGAGKKGTWYFVPTNETAHTFPWRRRIP